MSLKTQLRVAIVTLVAFQVIAQSVVSLRLAAESKFSDELERAQAIAELVRDLVVQRVNEQARTAQPPPSTTQEVRELFQKLAAADRPLESLLSQAAGIHHSAIAEIMVADDAGKILASSVPTHVGTAYPTLPALSEWRNRPLWDRLAEVIIQLQRRDYAITIPIGVAGEKRPILNIRVVASTVFMREAIAPHVKDLAWVSLLTLLASVVLVYLFSNVLLRSLDRLSERIASIATGQFTERKPATGKEAKEFADMQSKLDVLSQQFRGAREDMTQLRSNIERMIEGLEEGFLLFNPDHQLVRASHAIGALLATAPEQLVGRRLQDLFPASTPLGGVLRDAIERDQPIRDVIVNIERGAAGPLRMLVNVEQLESFPEPGRDSLLVTLRDAETRRQLRSQLDISTRLAAISRLTGGVAHEIKNPLNAMALHLEILKSKLDGDDRVDKEVNVIGGEIARLDRVVKTFLDFTRPVDLRLKDLNLVEIARQVAALVWPEAERSGVSVELEAPQPNIVVRGDEDLLKQALLNVVNNGIEAMKGGGRLRLAVVPEGEEVLVTVDDRGAGIPEDLRDKIFSLYFTTKEKGSGIGLAMTFRIVQLHSGTIDFTSRPGEGTTFRMRFPLAEEPAERRDAAPGSKPAIVEQAQ